MLAEKVGVPLAPWSGGPVETREDARRHAEAIGYPLIIKARSGGGGRGIRKVFAPDELEVALERTQGEAERSFGDPVVFLERLVTDARHVEVQVIADNYGNVWAPGVRDCSIQRRNQKVIEESSSPLLTKEQADHLRSVSAELVRAAGYRGAGTVEYLYQPDQKRLHVPRGQHPAAGRAPDHRGHHRHRPGQAADIRRQRRHSRRRLPSRVRPRRRGSAQRRRCRQRVRARAGHRAAAEVPARLRHPRRHRHCAGRCHPARLRLDGRQDHRVGPRPKRSAGSATHCPA